MRHDLRVRPISTGARSMCEPAAAAALVAPSGCCRRCASRLRRARSAAVDLTAIAAATDDHLHATALAQEEAAVVGHRRRGSSPGPLDATEDECNNDRRTRVQHGVGRDGGSLVRVRPSSRSVLGRDDYPRRPTRSRTAARHAWPSFDQDPAKLAVAESIALRQLSRRRPAGAKSEIETLQSIKRLHPGERGGKRSVKLSVKYPRFSVAINKRGCTFLFS